MSTKHFDNANLNYMEKNRKPNYKNTTKDRSYLEYVMAYNRVTEVKDIARSENKACCG